MKRIIIFGASSGIGKMLAQMYAKEGNMVVASARREENLVALQGEFPNNIVAHAADVTAADVRETFYFMVERLSGADLVIYCSGMGKQNAAFDMGIEHSTIDVNVKGFTELAAAVVEYGSKVQHHVQFVTVSSIASTKGIGISASYSASKMYQVRYMESLRQLSNAMGWNMSFTTIKPGFIATDFIKDHSYPMTMKLPYAVKRIKRAIDCRRNSVVIDWRWGLVVGFWKLIPDWIWYRLPIKSRN